MQGQGRARGRAILVSVDDTEDSLEAVNWVLNNFPAAPGDTLHLCHVAIEQQVDRAQELYDKRFLPILSQQSKLAYTFEALPAGGDAHSIGSAICNRAQQLHAALLVLAPHSKGAVRRALLGSVTDHCVQRCPAPVLIVKA